MKRSASRLTDFLRRYRWRALVPGWLILISGSWVADGIKGEVLFEDWPWGQVFANHWWLGLTFAAVCLVGASRWLYGYRSDFTLVRSLSQVECPAHRSLVILVSTPNLKLKRNRDGSLHLPLQDGSVFQLTGNLNKDIGKIPPALRWNWQQLLRGLRPHAGMLERVRLVGSSGGKGSFGYLASCKAMLQQYLPSECIITPHPQEADFENFNGLVGQLRKIVEEETKKDEMTDEDIIIDITGGPKTASIAGSSITFTTKVTFQYVQTHPPFEVYAYDVVQQAPWH